ncbi:MAG: hypothetical protein JO103_15465 [Candidatus Eremiobacteraeota bacterium]|nr:hypothetical protein [Candidatus Eremiobacteraeota bacterium]
MPFVRRALLAVLSAWHGLAAVKNVCDLCAELDLVPGAAAFGSKNFAAIEKLLAPLRLPREAIAAMLTAVVGMETAIALAFARGDDELAFGLGVLLIGSFALVDEAMVDYGLDETHREILVLLLVSYVVLRRQP